MGLALMVAFLIFMVALGTTSLYIICALAVEYIKEVYDFEN